MNVVHTPLHRPARTNGGTMEMGVEIGHQEDGNDS